MRIFYFEPDYRGYRQIFLDGLRRNSRHEIVSFTLPEASTAQARRFSLLPFLDKVSKQQEATFPHPHGSTEAARVDALITTDPNSLCDLYGLGRQWLAGVPSAILFHEYSFTKSEMNSREDQVYRSNLLHSLLGADRLIFCSESHKQDCWNFLPSLIHPLPEFPGKSKILQSLQKKSMIIRPGVSLRDLDTGHHELKYNSPTLLWNLRWENNKHPEVFFQVVSRLAGEGLDFGIVLCGRSPETLTNGDNKNIQAVFDEARHRLGDRVFHCGYVPSRAEYANLLWMSDIVVSTAETHYYPTAIIEAAFCEAYPIIPNRLEYPAVMPAAQRDRFIYTTPDELYSKLKNLLLDPLEIGSAQLRHHLLTLEWERLVKEFDNALVELNPAYRTTVI